MKMNFKYVMLMAATLVLGLSSCSKDDETSGSKVPTGAKSAKLSVVLVDGGSPVTYAAPSGDTDPATQEESRVVDGSLYIFDAKTDALEAVSDSLTGIQLTPGTKSVYFIGNAADAANGGGVVAPSFALGTTLTDFLDASKDGIADIEVLTQQKADPSGYYYISNVGAAGTINVAAGVTSNMTLNIGRGVAKINIEVPSTVAQPSTGKLSNTTYTIYNNPVETYLIPHYDANGQVQTPFYAETAPITTSNYFNAASGLPTDGTVASYAVENAHAAPLMGNSTYALIEGVFEPGTTVDANGTATNYTSGDDFYRIQYIETDVNGDVHDRGFYGKFFTVAPVTGDAEYTNAEGAKPGPTFAGTVDAKVVTYTGGKCYYYLYIGDPKETDDVAKHTVERNKYYYLTINSISDCGLDALDNPTSPSGTPNIAPATNSYLNVTFSVAPWSVVGGAGGIQTGI